MTANTFLDLETDNEIRRDLMRGYLVGITGAAGAGKDTAADYLVRYHGFTKYSLATPIKELLNARFGWTPEMWANRDWKEAAIPACGFNSAHGSFFSPRAWAQWLGTEVGRTLDPDVWTRLMIRKWAELTKANPEARMVVSDVRFDNEALAISKLGGEVLHIYRPDAGAVLDHLSEAGVSSALVDLSITNTQTVQEFELQVGRRLRPKLTTLAD
jgi:hypothetical protein